MKEPEYQPLTPTDAKTIPAEPGHSHVFEPDDTQGRSGDCTCGAHWTLKEGWWRKNAKGVWCLEVAAQQSLYAHFSGVRDTSGALLLQATFLGQGQRFHLHVHQSSQTLACEYTPLAVIEKQVLCDRNEAPPITLVRDDGFTVFVFERGCICSATTYRFDGNTILEKSSIGTHLEIVVCRISPSLS